MTADLAERLEFVIEDRAGFRVLAWPDGGCRPATEEECAMWDALRSRWEPIGYIAETDAKPGVATVIYDSPDRIAAVWADRKAVAIYLHPTHPGGPRP